MAFPPLSLKGNQMQWARQIERIHGSRLRASENTLSSMTSDMIFWHWTWSFSGLFILKKALVPSVENLSTFEFPHDFMEVRLEDASHLLPSFICAILAMGGQQGTTALAESSQRKMKLKSSVPYPSSCGILQKLQTWTLENYSKETLAFAQMPVCFISTVGFISSFEKLNVCFPKAPRQTSFLCLVVDNLFKIVKSSKERDPCFLFAFWADTFTIEAVSGFLLEMEENVWKFLDQCSSLFPAESTRNILPLDTSQIQTSKHFKDLQW